MYCKHCGSEINEGNRYCPNCGTPIAEDIAQTRQQTDDSARPNNHLLLAILTTIFCCLPFGIVSIIYSAKTDDAWNDGNSDAAVSYSRKARNFALWGIFSIVILFVLYVALIVAGISVWGDLFDEPIQELFTS